MYIIHTFIILLPFVMSCNFLLFRYYLAGLHFNANSDRMQAVTRDGRPKFSVRFPKYKKPGEYSVRAVKSEPSYGKQLELY